MDLTRATYVQMGVKLSSGAWLTRQWSITKDNDFYFIGSHVHLCEEGRDEQICHMNSAMSQHLQEACLSVR